VGADRCGRVVSGFGGRLELELVSHVVAALAAGAARVDRRLYHVELGGVAGMWEVVGLSLGGTILEGQNREAGTILEGQNKEVSEILADHHRKVS
jgi:hypothetical protein